MFARIAWGFCRLAFEASLDACFPAPMQRIFRWAGVFWYWAALLLEGRALEVWRELRAENARLKRSGWLRASRSQLGFGCRIWARTAVRAPAGLLGRLRGHLFAIAEADPPRVLAWSLPNVSRIRELGLGRVWVVLCPFCQRFHMHAPEEGSRIAPCRDDIGQGAYVLHFANELPQGLRNRLRREVTGDWPKLLLDWDGANATTQSAAA